jgi:small subunit ribosomal protein S10
MFRVGFPRVGLFSLRQFSTSSAAPQAAGKVRPETGTAQPEAGKPDKLFKCIDIELRAHEPAVLKSYSWFLNSSATELDIIVDKSYALEDPDKKRQTLLKSAFVHKKHRVQYEMRTYYHFITLKHLTGSTADTYLEYVQRNLPEGVSMKVIKTELMRQLSKLQPPKPVSANKPSESEPSA